MNPAAPSPSDSSIAQAFREMCEESPEAGVISPAQARVADWINSRARELDASAPAPAAAVGGDVVATFSGRRLSPEGTREFYGYLVEGIDTLPEEAPLYTTPQELRLDKPATIRSTTFGVGVKWATVIERAQREHEYQKQEKKERKTPAAPAGGFVVVPREPTEAMHVAGINVRLDGEPNAYAIWKAMIAASPAAQPSAKDGVRGDDNSYGSLAHRLYCEVACNGDPACFFGLNPETQQKWIDGVEKVMGNTAATSQAITAAGLVDELRALIAEWRTRRPACMPDTSRILMREYCADQLEAAIGREVGE